MAYVVAISAFFVVAAFGMFIKYDCGNGAQLEAMASGGSRSEAGSVRG